MKSKIKPESKILHQKAEDLLKGSAAINDRSTDPPVNTSTTQLSEAEARKLINELKVHQIELEMQNEELIQAKRQADIYIRKYAELYDFAPSGYFTLSAEGDICELNLTGSLMLGWERLHLIYSRFGLFVSDETKPAFSQFLEKVFTSEAKESCEVTLLTNGSLPMVVHLTGIISENKEHCLVIAVDVTERKLREDERAETARLVALLDTEGDLHKVLSDVTASLQGWSGCEAVGIRLHSGDDYPYYETHGFPPAFVKAENYLCSYNRKGEILRDGNGNPILECMCGNILQGRFDAAKPFFTPRGSFWSNSTTALLASTTEADRQVRTRNRCNGEGYESVALIPIHYGDRILGLIQFNDRRINCFTSERIAQFEKLADSLAISLSQREVKNALQIANRRIENIIESAQAGTWEWNVETGETVFNEQWAQIIGYTLEELAPVNIGTWMAVAHPHDLQLSDELLTRHFAGELPYYDCECRVRHKDGHWVWVHDRGCLITRTDTGKPLMMFGTHTDISQRKQAENTLLFNKNLIECSSSAIAACSLQGNMTFGNLCFRKMWGFNNDDEFMGKPFWKLWLLEDKSDEIMQALQSEGTWLGETMAVRKDGTCFEVQVLAAMIYDFEGNPVALTSTSIDVTERNRANAEIKFKNEELRKLNEEKDKFFSVIAHDLKSPFNALLGFAQMLDEDLPSLSMEEVQAIARSIRNSSNNLFRLLGNLLEWSRMQRGAIRFAPETFLLKPKLDDSLRSVMESANKKGIGISYDIAQDLVVFADWNMLESTIRNLTTNALKFTNRGGEIIIAAKKLEGNAVEISVRDTGIGMSKELLEKLFLIGDQISRRGTGGETGSGLGLIICQDFIEKHGGKIRVESEEGKGSVFYFNIQGDQR